MRLVGAVLDRAVPEFAESAKPSGKWVAAQDTGRTPRACPAQPQRVQWVIPHFCPLKRGPLKQKNGMGQPQQGLPGAGSQSQLCVMARPKKTQEEARKGFRVSMSVSVSITTMSLTGKSKVSGGRRRNKEARD